MDDAFFKSLQDIINEVDEIVNEAIKDFESRQSLEEKYERRGKCVYKKETDKKKGCSDSVAKAKKYVKALYAHADDINEDLEDYFTVQDDEEEGRFDDTPTEDLLNPDVPAPWEKI